MRCTIEYSVGVVISPGFAVRLDYINVGFGLLTKVEVLMMCSEHL